MIDAADLGWVADEGFTVKRQREFCTKTLECLNFYL